MDTDFLNNGLKLSELNYTTTDYRDYKDFISTMDII